MMDYRRKHGKEFKIKLFELNPNKMILNSDLSYLKINFVKARV